MKIGPSSRVVSILAMFPIAGHGLAQNTSAQSQHLVYSITRENETIGRLALDRFGSRVLVQYVGTVGSTACLFAPGYTLTFSGALPSKGASLFDAEATGRCPLSPLLPGGILGWNPIVGEGTQVMAVNMDAPGAAQKHILERAVTEVAPDGTMRRIATLHRDKVPCEWTYSHYITAGKFKVPSHIKRTKFKSAGLNIPGDETIVWTLEESSESPSRGLQDGDLLEGGALVQDVRISGKSKSFTYQREQELLTQADRATSEANPSGVSSSGRTRTIVLLLVGAMVGVAASFRLEGFQSGKKP